MNVQLCWKTCDTKIVDYFQDISPAHTRAEGKFLAELFLTGDLPLNNSVLKKHYAQLYNQNLINLLEEYNLIRVSKYSKLYAMSKCFSLDDNVRNSALVYFITSDIHLNYEQTVEQNAQFDSMLIENAAKNLTANSMQLRIKTLDSLIKNASDIGRTLEPRIVSDQKNIIKMLSRADPYSDNDTIINIKRCVKPGSTGRLYEIGGGLQNLSRASKTINYPDTKAYNYDIKNCAPSALAVYCNQLNIECSELNEYLNNPNSKQIYADAIGISVKTWKQCLLSCIFGATCESQVGSVASELKEEVGQLHLDATYARFKKTIGPLRIIIDKWLQTVLSYAQNSTDADGKIRNSVGSRISLYTGNKILDKRTLSAFYLQGLEASFIYHLIVALEQSDVKVLSYEFDGLITDKPIDSSVVQQCQQQSGFTNAVLEIKPFE